MSLWDVLRVGGFTMYLLLLCSILSLTIIIERFLYYRARSRLKRENFMEEVTKEISAGNIKKAAEACASAKSPLSCVVQEGINAQGKAYALISSAMEREVARQTARLEKYTGIVGTIGSTAVYIGLFGTVLGIIRTFHDIAKGGSGGISVVIDGIAEALVCTAAGLCVAVPAVIAYNYFMKRVDGFVTDMQLCASETLDLLGGTKHK
jgi:biopolymer transport protein ExbB